MTTILASIVYLAILVRKRALALRYAREHAAPAGDRSAEPVTILQPILGGDPALEETLAWNVSEHPTAAFVWLVDEDDDLGRSVCARLAARHARSDLRILVCAPAPASHNPKLFKLSLAESDIRTERFVVLDDDTMLSRGSLDALRFGLDAHALATGLPSYVPAATVAGRLVARFVNDNAALTYLATAAVMPPVTINGMCYATTRATLRAIGGFGAYVRWLPDDLAIARGVASVGGTIVQTPVPHRIRTSVRDGGRYVRLLHRWFLFALLLLGRVPPRTRATIVAWHAVPPLVLWVALATALASRRPRALVALAMLLGARAAIRADVARRVLGPGRHEPLLSLVSELAEPLHAAHAALHRTIRWRSRRIVVRDADDFTVVA
jgi:ceramide glucosyltransferase